MRSLARRRLGAVGVVVGEFPSLSETFVLREMRELERRGFQLVPLALHRPGQGPFHGDAEDLGSRTVYRERPLSVASLLRQVQTVVRYPLGWLGALGFVVSQMLRSPGLGRELLVSLAAAGDFAAAIPRRAPVSHVHAQFCSMPATVGLLLAEIMGVTFSVSCHARDVFTREAILLGYKLSEAEFCTVCNRLAQERLLRQYGLTAAGKLHLVYHGLDPTRYMPPANPPRPPRKVLSVGRLVTKKGFDILLRAAAVARSRGAEFELHIVGEGPEREDLERLATGLGLRDMTTFHGRMTQEELLPLYQQAYAFALASVVTEDGDRDGVPNVLVEALAMGIPTVATATGGIPELIIHGETGLLAQPGDPEGLADQLERILYDEELRDRVRKAGREKVVREFDIARNIETLVNLLSRLARCEPQGF